MMKTYTDLYPTLVSFENLHRAYRKARRGKRRTPAAAAFEYNLEANLFDLQLISFDQYERVSLMVNEVGKLLGGWIKKV